MALLPYCGGNPRLFDCPAQRWPKFDMGGERLTGWSGGKEILFTGLENLSYGYNAAGTEDKDAGYSSPSGTTTLGLGEFGAVNTPVSEARVLNPSDMIAVGDGTGTGITGFGFPLRPTWFTRFCHEDGRENGLFCDGHVESNNPAKTPTMPAPWLTNPNALVYRPDTAFAQRWNNDNQPHPETWPNY